MGAFDQLISRLVKIRNFRKKRDERSKRTVPTLSTPTYYNRHSGATFLVLGLGPSLLDHRQQIFDFIDNQNPIVIGANNVTEFIYPDYHAFTNRARFLKYAHRVDSEKSKVLISPYMAKWFIREYYQGAYEEIMYHKDDARCFDIQEGVIMAGCQSVSVLSIGLAVVMGAVQIFVAGLDGYSKVLTPERQTHFYGKENQKDEYRDDAEFLRREKVTNRFLDEISQYMVERGLDPFGIITPTSYEQHYQPINQTIKIS